MGIQPHFCCGETAGWITMQLDTEVGLDRGHVVLDGAQLPPTERGTAAPHILADVSCGQTVTHLSSC